MSKPNLVRVRAAPAYATAADIRNINVDRQNLIVRNAVVMTANVEAIGHGLMADSTTLAQTAALGNARTNGTQGRLGHPGASDNAAGRQLFTARNFRTAGDRLLADLHMFEPARRSPAFGNDPIEWMLDMAEQHPDQLALSVIIKAAPVWVLDTGEEISAGVDGWIDDSKPDNATTDLPVMRVESLWAVDLVNEGALTHEGMFSPNEAAYYAEAAFDFVDEWRRQFNIPLADVPGKVEQVLARYLNARGYDPRKDTEMAAKTAVKPTSRRTALDEQKPADPVMIVGGDDPESEVGEDTQPIEAPPAAPETEPAADPLAQAEAAADETTEVIETPSAEPAAAETSASADFSSEVTALKAKVAELEKLVERLTALTVKNTNHIAALAKDVRRIDGEPFVTESVPKTRPIGVDAGKQTPSAAVLKAAATSSPSHVVERAGGKASSSIDPALASLRASASRTSVQK